jgi:UDP-GlcNAc:undecaprenyl-phosphate GlcNAc-1-phosphate transferase
MMQQFIDSFYFYYLELLLLAITFSLLIVYKNKVHQFLNISEYKSQQRLHLDEVPRFGGIIIYLFFFAVLALKFDNELLRLLLLSFLPMAILTIKEDLHYETSPLIRILFMVFSCLIFTVLMPGNFPTIDIPVVGKWLEVAPIQISFYIFSIMVIMNGNNLIDGVNGSMTITNIVQLIALCLLSTIIGDGEFLQLCIFLILPLIVFLPFNFPFGKIFIGDTGAYLFGFLIGGLVIYFFGKHNEVLSWNAILLLFYPSFELLFSFIRKKFIDRISPFNADSKHLHSIIYRYLHTKKNNNNNSKTVISLIPFISAPFLALLFFDSIFCLFLSLIFLVVIYVFMYVYYVTKVMN